MNMEIICPHCGQPIAISEDAYAKVLSQVKNKEFAKELEQQLALQHQRQLDSQRALDAQCEQKHQQELNRKDQMLTEKDSEITLLQGQLRNADTLKQMEIRDALAERERQYQEQKAALELRLKELESKIENSSQERTIAIMQEQNRNQQQLQERDNQIQQLRNQLELSSSQALNRESTLKEQYENRLALAQGEIERLKDFKVRLSTKMVGESLERHCSNEFNKVRSMGMYPNSYFEKDNDSSNGSKGDFIFRDYAEGQEYISIMFEMKNEADATATKHRNEDFFAKLDKDRNEKQCEYAVLVSMLEPDNEYYNEGIVDVSYRYPKMIVIRPQFFLPLIALLSQASFKSIQYKRELEIARNQHIDVTNFEQKVDSFRQAFGNNVRLALKQHDDAVEKIDSAIKTLQTIKELFEKSNRNLSLAEKKVEEDLTVRKLTYKNPTMKALFEEAKNQSQGIEN